MTETESRTGRRRHRTHLEAAQLAAEFNASGLTRQAFCERSDVSLNTLARYLKKHGAGAGASDRWVSVEIADSASTGLAVLLPGGRRIEVGRGFDTSTLQQLVAALERC